MGNNKDFKILSDGIRRTLKANEKKGLGDQKQQVELLFSLEMKFKSDFQKHPQHIEIYEKFIKHIKEDLGNILISKTFFREKNTLFNKDIGRFIKKDNAVELVKYNFNYNFIKFIMTNWEGSFPQDLGATNKLILEIRSILVENNLPLAINRAKNFYSKTHPQDMTMNDLIGICVQGLLVGIDKYVGDYTTVWRSVCIGRMVGFMIKDFNDNLIKMHPKDKSILYRTNSLLSKRKPNNIDDLTQIVKDSYAEDKSNGKSTPNVAITAEYLNSLLNSNHRANPFNEGSNQPMSRDCRRRIEREIEDSDMNGSEIENNQAIGEMRLMYKDLSVIELKVLRLKGVVI